jgi:ATP-dependent helicase/nuclease subunit A
MELTEVQKRAVESADRNLVVSAGAGTGKTAVLVARFVNIVRRRLATVNDILTITFTEKAAEEMKHRIADTFRRLGMRKERTAVETAYVSTIHSFCSRLIREYPFVAGVDPGFEILDEIDRQLMLSDLFNELFSEGETDFLELAERYGERDISRAIISYVDLCRSLGRGVDYIQELVAEPDNLTQKAESLANERALEAMRGVRESRDALSSMEASGVWEEKRREMVSLCGSLSGLSSFREAAEAVVSITRRMPGVQKKGDGRAACLQVREELSRIGKLLKQEEAAVFFDRDTEQMLLPCKVALLKGAVLFWRQYEARKRERGLLDYEDLQLIARGLLRDDLALRRDYAHRFRYVLVDEFQDINRLQQELIELLTSGRNLFVVGDACQSIYGFRNADVEILMSLMEKSRSSSKTHDCLFLSENFRSGRNLIGFFNFLFSGLLDRGGTEFHPLQYARGGSEDPAAPSVEIMLFQPKEEEGGGREDADRVRQREAAAVAARIIEAVRKGEIVVFDPATASGRPLRFGDVAVLCRTRASYAAYSEAFTERGIPFCLVGGQSFYEKQEIADLINLLTIIDNPLRDIPMVAVLRSPFVGVTDDTLVLLGRRSKTATHGTVSTGGRSADSTALEPTAKHRFHYLLNAIREVDAISEMSDSERGKLLGFLELLDDLRRSKNATPLHTVLGMALDRTPYLTRILASPSGAQKAANVSKFLDLLREYEARHGGGIGGFLQFYEVMRYYGPREEEAALESFSGDVVKLMTIHAAKGLEFPVVVVADMARRFNFDTDRFLVSREMEIGCSPWQESLPESSGRKLVFEERKSKQVAEEKRLLYVAATRARDHLILAGGYRPEREREIDQATCPMDWVMAIVGEQAALPESGHSSDVRLREAIARMSVDAIEESAPVASGASLLEQQSDRIAGGEEIPVDEEATERCLPRVKNVLARIASGSSVEPDATPAEISISQLLEFEECPRKFFLREIIKFPEREVMIGLGLCSPRESSEKPTTVGAAAGPAAGVHGRRFGELVHQCMEQLDFRAGEQQNLTAITARFFTSSGAASAAEELIRRFVRSEDGGRLRNAREMYRELPVKALLGEVVLNGVIDVLYLDDQNSWTILDFKTGSEQVEAESHEPSGYEFQMLLYAFLVKEAIGVAPEKALIHFLRSGASRQVSTTAEAIERTERRAAEIVTAIGRQEFRKARDERCGQCEYVGLCASQNDD